MSRPRNYTDEELDHAVGLAKILGSTRAASKRTGIGISTLLAHQKRRVERSAEPLVITVRLDERAVALIVSVLDEQAVQLVDVDEPQADYIAELAALLAGRHDTDSTGITAVVG